MTTYTGSYKKRILHLLRERGVAKSICPSEILPPHLKQSKKAMACVRQAAEGLRRDGQIEVLRRGQPVTVGSRGPIRFALKKRSQVFDYSLNFKKINFRKQPELYRIGKGEQGVLMVEPYKSELLPHWKFKTPQVAHAAAKKIYAMFLAYGRKNDFVGMDMARKFLQMGVTRSRRYANHKSGQKYVGPVPKSKRGQSGAHGRAIRALDRDPLKAQSAQMFALYLAKALKDRHYLSLKKRQIEF